MLDAWVRRLRQMLGRGDLQDGLLQHYQREVDLSDWSIERKVAEAMDGNCNPDLFGGPVEDGVHAADGESDDTPEG